MCLLRQSCAKGLFSGIVICPGCGRKLVGNFKKPTTEGGNGTYAYRCNKFRQEGTCEFRYSTSERKIEKQLLTNLETYIQNEIIKVESLADVAQPKTDNTLKIEELKKEIDRLNMMFRKGRIEEDEYDTEYLKLNKALKKIDVEEKPVERNLDILKGLLETDYKGLYEELDREHKKAFWRNLIREFKVDANKKIVPESIIFF